MHILTEGVLGLITAIRSYDLSGEHPGARTGITAEEKARLTGRGIRIVQDGLPNLSEDDRQELASAFRRLAARQPARYASTAAALANLQQLPSVSVKVPTGPNRQRDAGNRIIIEGGHQELANCDQNTLRDGRDEEKEPASRTGPSPTISAIEPFFSGAL